MKRANEYQNKLATVVDSELLSFWNSMKNNFPEIFANTPQNLRPLVLRQALSLRFIKSKEEIIHLIVYGYKWIRILGLVIKFVVYLFVILMIIGSILKLAEAKHIST